MEVFKSKIPTMRRTDFDLVKCEKNAISLPVVKTGHKWDFAHVKNLCRQGRLYVKLNVPKDELLDRGNSDDELSRPTFLSTESTPVIEEDASSVQIIHPNSVLQQSRQYGYGRREISSTGSSSFITRPGPSHDVHNDQPRVHFSAPPPLHSNHEFPGPSSSQQFQSEASQIESLRANISSPF